MLFIIDGKRIKRRSRLSKIEGLSTKTQLFAAYTGFGLFLGRRAFYQFNYFEMETFLPTMFRVMTQKSELFVLCALLYPIGTNEIKK